MWDHRVGQSQRSRRNAHHHHGNHRNVYPNLWRKREQELKWGTWENKTVKEAHSGWALASTTSPACLASQSWLRAGSGCVKWAVSSASHWWGSPPKERAQAGVNRNQKHASPGRDLPEGHETRRWLGEASWRRRGLNWTLRYIMGFFKCFFKLKYYLHVIRFFLFNSQFNKF